MVRGLTGERSLEASVAVPSWKLVLRFTAVVQPDKALALEQHRLALAVVVLQREAAGLGGVGLELALVVCWVVGFGLGVGRRQRCRA